MRVIVEFVKFLRDRKKYWLIPIFLWLALVGGLVVATQGSAIAPFIYTLLKARQLPGTRTICVWVASAAVLLASR